ncbi:MAG: hypothetical protein EZS28_047159, partial [Streblomastix strix]
SFRFCYESDIWSLGVILVECLTGIRPYEGHTPEETINNIKNGSMDPLPDEIKGEIGDMILGMLNVEPTKRPSASDLLKTDLMLHQVEIEIQIEQDKKLSAYSTWEKISHNVSVQKISIWENIKEDLLQPLVGTQEQIQSIIEMQEMDCKLLSQQLEDRYDDEFRGNIIDSGVAEGLQFIFENRELNLISRPLSYVFFDLTSPASDKIRLQLYEIQPFLGLIRLLEHSDILVVVDAIHSLFNILASGAETAPRTEPHPQFDDLSSWNGIEKIFQLFRRNLDKNSKNISSFCIGIIFRAKEFADQTMGLEIISHLKSLLSDQDVLIKETAKFALKDLAQNEEQTMKCLLSRHLYRQQVSSSN